MAFGSFEKGEEIEANAEINMVPFTDVMLVLLIIFMITAPMMTSRLKLDLPRAETQAPPPVPPAVITIALTADGRTHLDDLAVDAAALQAQVQAQAKSKPDTEVQLRADRVVPYERVAQLIGILQKAGLTRIAFVTEAADAGPAPAPTSPGKP